MAECCGCVYSSPPKRLLSRSCICPKHLNRLLLLLLLPSSLCPPPSAPPPTPAAGVCSATSPSGPTSWRWSGRRWRGGTCSCSCPQEAARACATRWVAAGEGGWVGAEWDGGVLRGRGSAGDGPTSRALGASSIDRQAQGRWGHTYSLSAVLECPCLHLQLPGSPSLPPMPPPTRNPFATHAAAGGGEHRRHGGGVPAAVADARPGAGAVQPARGRRRACHLPQQPADGGGGHGGHEGAAQGQAQVRAWPDDRVMEGGL